MTKYEQTILNFFKKNHFVLNSIYNVVFLISILPLFLFLFGIEKYFQIYSKYFYIYIFLGIIGFYLAKSKPNKNDALISYIILGFYVLISILALFKFIF